MTTAQLQAELNRLDKGILLSGAHPPGDQFCALEFSSQVRQKPWSDAPGDLPDVRALNDAPWSSAETRTAALLPVMAALWDWRDWSNARQKAWAQKVAVLTVQCIIAELPGLPDAIRIQCREAVTLSEVETAAEVAARAAEAAAGAARAAGAAGAAGAAKAAGAAEAAAGAARAAGAAEAAEAAAGVNLPIQTACHIWIQAATDTEGL